MTSNDTSVAWYKKAATLLQRDIRHDDPQRRELAATRLQRLQTFAGQDLAQISALGAVQRKYALALVAIEAGYSSWADLKLSLEPELDFSEFFGWRRFGIFSHHWFSTYPEARAHLKQCGGYLLPYRQQFFVACEYYIENLGLAVNDKDWKGIGYDWVEPVSPAAHQRLREKLQGLHRQGM
jgi:hypothetical protein